ncbi:unnamed protein product [Coffea canephora]|uniref:Uncharacterized protein n=1 Tax=Coffea canephora TaxID=49390 RepID=A0A068TMG1_COFCA|nr:unnamed protein product [Coffea canephora]
MAHVSDIKLIRTDTTLDLSQKAEKGMRFSVLGCAFYAPEDLAVGFRRPMWEPRIDRYYEGCSFHPFDL